MGKLDFEIRAATRDDALDLAKLINQAGEGLPLVFWQALAEPGQDAWAFGEARVASEDAGISYRNAWIAYSGAKTAGCLITYRQPSKPEPIPDDAPAMFRPLLELEAEAPDTGYIYVLSTMPAMQGQGVGSRLLEFSERYRGPKGMSLIVSDANIGARRLYERHGYMQVAARTMVKEDWDNPGQAWHLLVKPPQ